MILMLDSFGLCGIPENCINALFESSLSDFTCVSNNTDVDNDTFARII
ncbi:hypothetical protein ACFFUE_02435 [Bergeyella porcorum]